jgi:hypothetical protein
MLAVKRWSSLVHIHTESAVFPSSMRIFNELLSAEKLFSHKDNVFLEKRDQKEQFGSLYNNVHGSPPHKSGDVGASTNENAGATSNKALLLCACGRISEGISVVSSGCRAGGESGS